MKNSPYAIERHSHSGSTPFGYFYAQSQQERFDLTPGNIGTLRTFTECFQSFAVTCIHNDLMIPQLDTKCKQQFTLSTERFIYIIFPHGQPKGLIEGSFYATLAPPTIANAIALFLF